MKNPFDSTKFIAGLLSSLLMGVLVAFGVDTQTAAMIAAPLAAYIPVQGLVDLRKPHTEAKPRKGD